MSILVFPPYIHLYTQVPRADALYCLHSQAEPSLMACEKQMPPLAALVFHGAHYIKNTYLNYIFNILHISCYGL